MVGRGDWFRWDVSAASGTGFAGPCTLTWVFGSPSKEAPDAADHCIQAGPRPDCSTSTEMAALYQRQFSLAAPNQPSDESRQAGDTMCWQPPFNPTPALLASQEFFSISDSSQQKSRGCRSYRLCSGLAVHPTLTQPCQTPTITGLKHHLATGSTWMHVELGARATCLTHTTL